MILVRSMVTTRSRLSRYLGVFLFFVSASAFADGLEALPPLVPEGAPPLKSPLKSQIAGKARVWIFLSAKCPCSNSHVGKLKEAFAEFSKLGFEFVAVHSNQDEPKEFAQKYFSALNLDFPVYRDPDAQVANHFRALKTPHVFVELPDRSIAYDGGIDESKKAHTTDTNYLRDALRDIHEGRPVKKARTRTLGCAISRRKPS